MDTQCGICQQPVRDRRYRKTILGDSAKDYVSTLVNYSKEHFPGYDLALYLSALPLNSAYICRTCQQVTHKYAKLKAELDQATEEIREVLQVLLGLQPQTSGPATTTVQTTPIRPRTTKDSPAVAVSTH